MERDYNYYQWSVADIVKHLETDLEKGLSSNQAQIRLSKNGSNTLAKSEKTTALAIFLRQFANLFVLILILAAIISYFVDGPIQALILLLITAVNVGLGFFQEYKAERSMSELRKTYWSNSDVYRDGKIANINSEEIVPGDIVLLNPGSKVPADLRLFEEVSLQINESILTGESLPVSKTINVLPIDTVLADRKNLAFAGTIIQNGHGKGIAIKTGAMTEFGKIANLVSAADEPTPLEKQVAYLAKVFSVIGVILSLLVFGVGYLQGYEVWKLLTFTIALLIAVVPESLPTAITLSLAIGVTRMSKKKAIVRRLAVIEALGSTNIIATDKTGTLTNNELSIQNISIYNNGQFVDYDAKRDILQNKRPLQLLVEGLICSNVDFNNRSNLIGDPLEVAIAKRLDLIDRLDLFLNKKLERLMEIPFDSDKKYMAVLISRKGRKSLITKGSPEKVVNFCSLSRSEKKAILLKAELLSKEGYKVLAMANKQLGTLKSSALSGMDFQGLFAFVDEPVRGVAEAMKSAIAAGIRPIMITGDHPETARYIGNKVGLNIKDGEVMTATELMTLKKTELIRALGQVKVFARVTPTDKIKIVQKLQELGYSVAMTGDGVNDAPALKEAEVGIAMGVKGTDIARESADIILSNDQYGTIISAIEYGRTIYDNIKNIVTELVSSNFNEILLVFAAFIFGLPLPFVTLQILWVNLIIESFAGLSFSFEKPSKHVLKEKPRSNNINSMRSSIVYSVYLALFSFSLSFLIYLWGLDFSVVVARTLVFTYIVLSELAFALSIRSKKRIWQSPMSFFENHYLICSVFLAIFLQGLLFLKPLAEIFSITTLNYNQWSVIIISVFITFFAAEIIRHLLDRRHIA